MSDYAEAVTALYRAPFGEFVSERKRLANELKAGGNKDGAARLSKLARPPVSAFAVNQLWWQERAGFEELLAAAARVKGGDREASRAHREALARLREHATRILQASGNAASEPTLRRVTTTLAAIAAAGGFEPDPPGALSADRDPPGFEALGFAAAAPAEAASKKPAEARAAEQVAEPATETARVAKNERAAERAREAEQRRAEAEQRRAEAERRRAEAETQKQRLAERARLSGELKQARALQATQQRELGRRREEVEAAEQSLKQTQALLAELEEQLTSL